MRPYPPPSETNRASVGAAEGYVPRLRRWLCPPAAPQPLRPVARPSRRARGTHAVSRKVPNTLYTVLDFSAFNKTRYMSSQRDWPLCPLGSSRARTLGVYGILVTMESLAGHTHTLSLRRHLRLYLAAIYYTKRVLTRDPERENRKSNICNI